MPVRATSTISTTTSRSSTTSSAPSSSSELLTHYNVKNVDELHAVIEKHTAGSKLLPVTQQIIASLGITSVEEWKKALEDKNLAALFCPRVHANDGHVRLRADLDPERQRTASSLTSDTR